MKILKPSLYFIISLCFLLGVSIETPKEYTWTTLKSVSTTGDAYSTIDNSSLTSFGNKSCVRILCSFGTINGTATIDVYGFHASTDNISDHLASLSFAADNITVGGRYVTEGQTVDMAGTSNIKIKVTTLSTSDNVSVYALPY